MKIPFPVLAYRLFSIAAFIGILFDGSFRRLIWGGFCAALFVSAEKFKDVEKIKLVEREKTERRMEKAYNEGWSAGLGGQYKFVTENIALAFEGALKQVATYVRSTQPQPGVDEYVIQSENGSKPVGHS